MEENKYNFENSFEDSNDKISNEELKNKLKITEEDNERIKNQLFSLQNKFYVQTKLLNDKNSELSKEISENEKIKIENEQFIKTNDEYKNNIENLTKENIKLKNNYNKIKKELNEMSNKLNESNLKTNYMIGQLEEQNSVLINENKQLIDTKNKLENQLNLIYNDKKEKESQIIFSLKNENKENEQNLKREIICLKQKNDNLIIENQELKKELKNIVKSNNESNKNSFNQNSNNINLIKNNSNNIIQNIELKLKEANEQINIYKDRIESLENINLMNDKKMKEIKLNLAQLEKESNNFNETIQIKEKEIIKLKNELNKFKVEEEKGKNNENLFLVDYSDKLRELCLDRLNNLEIC